MKRKECLCMKIEKRDLRTFSDFDKPDTAKKSDHSHALQRHLKTITVGEEQGVSQTDTPQRVISTL